MATVTPKHTDDDVLRALDEVLDGVTGYDSSPEIDPPSQRETARILAAYEHSVGARF